MENRCRALDLIQSNQLVKALPALPKPSQPSERKVSRNTYENVATQLQCSLCNESHRWFKCDKFLRMQPRQQLNYAKQSNLCFVCKYIPKTTSVPNNCVGNVVKDIIIYYTYTNNRQGTNGPQQITVWLQIRGVLQIKN
jgi:hypothetical protein